MRMTDTLRCPQCGDSETVTGTPLEGDILMTCGSCSTTWMRGPARCRGCGGVESVTRTQLMTRHPRGTLLSVVGGRDVVLCPRCDADVLAAVGGASSESPLPEGYVSRFFAVDVDPPTAAAPAPRVRRPRPPAPVPRGSLAVPPRPAPEPARLQAPTVRQAVEHFLEAHPGADSLAMLMLGQHLGPSTRLHQLGSSLADSLTTWLLKTWPDDRRREGPAAAVDAALAHWQRNGWLDAAPEH